MSGEVATSIGESEAPEYTRRTTMASQWPVDVDLDALYLSERSDVDGLVRSASDMSVWVMDNRKDNATVYVHSKNSERLSYSVRAVTKVAGSVVDVLECLRAVSNSRLKRFQKILHPRNFLDGEVLYVHQADSDAGPDKLCLESMSLKWLVFSSPKTLGRSKEFCIREYCVLLPHHPEHGNVGVLKFESYDGAAARYGIRGKPDAYSLTVFEPSSYIVQQSPEDSTMCTVTLTFAMRKARGGESVSAGVRLTSLRLAGDLSGMQKAAHQALFAPAALAQRQEWVHDAQRTNCSLCVQSFGMLKRRHHCRVCGEVVCSACTVFKMVNGAQDVAAKMRVCKACLAKGCNLATTATLNTGATVLGRISNPGPRKLSNTGNETDGDMQSGSGRINGMGIGTSIGSTGSLTSDESHSPPNDDPASSSFPTLQSNKGSGYTITDFEATPQMSDEGGSGSPPRLWKQTSSVSSQGRGTGYEGRPIGSMGRTTSNASIATSRKTNTECRIHYFNEDMEEICMLAMETLTCPMAGIRTEDFELVRYYDGKSVHGLPRSLPTFRRLATRGKPCIVLDVSSDKRISGDKRFTAKLQFFVGIPLLVNGEVVGDLCVADRYARDNIDHKQVEVLNVLGETVTQYMQSDEYQEDLVEFKATHLAARRPPTRGSVPQPLDDEVSVPRVGTKEVAF